MRGEGFIEEQVKSTEKYKNHLLRVQYLVVTIHWHRDQYQYMSIFECNET